MDRPSFEEIHMRMALLLRSRSTCARLQVGCVIASADYRKILAMGYNGNATGLPNQCDGTEPGKCGCFVSGTRVLPRGVTRAYRRWYEGEVVRVVTTAGEFTATLNHPILTFGRGWTPAQSLHEGDRLLGAVGDQEMFGGTPDDEHGVPIEEVFETLAITARTVRRTGTGHDFHGDGVVDEGIDVVSADRSLWPYLETGIGKSLTEPRFSTPLVVPTMFCGACPTDQFVATVDHETGFHQAVSNNDDTHLVAPSERDGRLSILIGSDDLPRRKIDHGLPFVSAEVFGVLAEHPSFAESVLDRGVRYTEGRRDVDHLLSAAVTLHNVLHVERYRWSGHVYNLETSSNWYSLRVGGIIAHNCLHGEENAVINCDSPRHWPKIVFCTNLPCPMCAKRLINLGGVERVYYHDDYRIQVGLYVLEQAGIEHERLVIE